MSEANVQANLAGGLVGDFRGAFIQGCMASGAVTAHTGNFPVAGGLVGQVFGGGPMYSFSIGAVSGTAATGGFVGDSVDGTYQHNYWNTTTSGTTTGCGGNGCGSDVTG